MLPSDPVAAAAIRSLLGESDVGTSGDEIAWAFRKLLEEQAPLVCVFDDMQWGEETFLDLVESTALLSTGAPLLLLCMARPELVERRPGWPATLRLEPLPPEQADALIGDGVAAELRERIAHAAGGNPLFISEMLAMAAENAEVEVPPTLKALLAMRLDQLDEPERKVLERGSVEGEIFHRGAVQALAPEETQVTTRLAALVRRQLVRPDRAQLAGDDGYRFRHLLIRDAAYDALPKAVRADLHARFADWLDEHGEALVERDEIVGYHLEQAARYHAELGQPDPSLADRAAARLAAAGNRAVDRQDYRAAAVLLDSRSRARTPAPDRPHARARVRVDSRKPRSACGRRDGGSGHRTCRAAGDHSGAMLGQAMALHMRNIAGEPDAADELIALCRAALPLEEERGDPRRLALLWELLAAAANFHQQNDDDVEASLSGAALPAPRRLLAVRDVAGSRADRRPAAGRRRDADDRRARRLAAPGLPGPPASGAARDARPFRRGMAARRGAVEPPSRGDRQHLAGRLQVPRADREDRRRPGARVPVHTRKSSRSSAVRRRPGSDAQGAVSLATSVISAASTRLSASSKRRGPSRRPVPAFG